MSLGRVKCSRTNTYESLRRLKRTKEIRETLEMSLVSLMVAGRFVIKQ